MSLIKRTILGWVGPNIMYGARIAYVKQVSEHFRFIDIEAEVFKTKNFQVGEKVQINTGEWNLRTYTPLSLNSEYGLLGVLAYTHGKGPGSRWADEVKVGDFCQVFGPHASLKLPAIKNSLIVFGDETTIGLATNLKRQISYPRSVKFIFEASSVEEVHKVTQELSLTETAVYEKTVLGVLSEEIKTAMTKAVSEKDCQVLLAGCAQSIQQMRAHLRSIGFPMWEVTSKVYWSDGKAGLD